MSEKLEIEGKDFHVARMPDGDVIFPDRESAVAHLQNNGTDIQDDPDDVTIINVSYEGDDWEIKEVPWKDIALLLLEGDNE